MNVTKLRAASRTSGPATVYDLNPDGTIKEVRTRKARSPHKPGVLTREESLFILMHTGQWPETLSAEIRCGVQANDYDLSRTYGPDRVTSLALRSSGILDGPRDDAAGGSPASPLVDTA
jgi:hypothetical protein